MGYVNRHPFQTLYFSLQHCRWHYNDLSHLSKTLLWSEHLLKQLENPKNMSYWNPDIGDTLFSQHFFFAIPKQGRIKNRKSLKFPCSSMPKTFWYFLQGFPSGAAPLSTRDVLVHFPEALVNDGTEVGGSNTYIVNESSSSTHLMLKGFSPLIIIGSNSLVFFSFNDNFSSTVDFAGQAIFKHTLSTWCHLTEQEV